MWKALLKQLLGYRRVRGQAFFTRLHAFAAHGMNFGFADCRESGELSALRYVRDRLGPTAEQAVVFDVGANVGEYTRYVHECLGPGTTIHAFEPGLGAFAQLVANTSGVGRVHPHQTGLGARNGTATLHLDRDASTIASIYPQRPDHPWRTDLRETIHVSTLDSVCLELGVRTIDLLKIDVEGHEFDVLQGAKQLLDKDALHFIQFEVGSRTVDARVFFRDFFDLLDSQYRLYRIVSNGLVPIDRYTEQHENFLGTINYLAEHRGFIAAGTDGGQR